MRQLFVRTQCFEMHKEGACTLGVVGRVTVFGYVEVLLLLILVLRFLNGHQALSAAFLCTDGLHLRLLW